MELLFDKEKNRKERIYFIHYYANWVKSVPNRVWSKHQAVLIDSFIENSRNLGISSEEYLKMMKQKQCLHSIQGEEIKK